VLTVDDRALLRDRAYTVFRGDQQVHRGLVIEKNIRSRRAQAFDSLQELLDALVQNDDLKSLPDLPYRTTFDDDPLELITEINAAATLISADDPPAVASISYFKLFHAMRMFRDKLAGLVKLEQLDNHVFSWPGCLLELIDKMHDEIRKPNRDMFNWFLANELHSLCNSAQDRRRSLVRGAGEREPGYTPIPPARWRKLGVAVPHPPTGVNEDYLDLIRKQCNYG
jgi:hypothetical protein